MSGAELEDVDAEVTPCEVDEELVTDPPHELAIMITTAAEVTTKAATNVFHRISLNPLSPPLA